MHIEQPLWIIGAFLAVALLLWSYRRLDHLYVAALNVFASARLVGQLTRSVSRRRVWIKRIAMAAAAVCICIALARPQGGYTTQVTHSRGLDILVAIDTSKSMLTPDVKPNRLERAKLAALDLLGQLHGDAVGLLAFAGNAFLQCPITTDYDAFRDSVEALDTNTIPRGGTDIAAAIHAAQATFATRPASDRILILMTDGEDLGEQGIAAARAAAQQGVRIFTVGVGTAGGGLIPVPDGNGGTRFLQDSTAQYVKSRLDTATLTQIAQAAGGFYAPLGNQGQGLTAIYARGLASFARHDLAARQIRIYTERYQWPLAAAIALLILESLLLTRRGASVFGRAWRKGTGRQPSLTKATATPALMALTAFAIGFFSFPGAAGASVGQAESAYHRGDFALASKEYEASARRNPTQAQLQFNEGSAAYKSGNLETATTAFKRAVATGDPTVQQSAYYNLGNTEYRIGQKTVQGQPEQTVVAWQGALKSYDAALQMRGSDADAKYNRALVAHNLEQLQKQQKRQDKQQSQQHQQDKQQSQKQQSPKQGGNGKPQQQSGSQQGKSGGRGGAQSAQGGKDANANQPSASGQNSGQGQRSAQNQTAGRGKGSGQNQTAGDGQSAPPSPSQTNAQGGPQQQPADAGRQADARSGTGAQPASPAERAPTPSPGSASGQARGPGKIEPSAGSPSAARAGAQGQPGRPGGESQRAAPGEMTREQAAQLLDSIKSDVHRLVAASQSSNTQSDSDSPPLKDW